MSPNPCEGGRHHSPEYNTISKMRDVVASGQSSAKLGNELAWRDQRRTRHALILILATSNDQSSVSAGSFTATMPPVTHTGRSTAGHSWIEFISLTMQFPSSSRPFDGPRRTLINRRGTFHR
jgi:hypothetical protein